MICMSCGYHDNHCGTMFSLGEEYVKKVMEEFDKHECKKNE